MPMGLGLGLGPTLGQGVGFSLDAFMASQADGLYFDTTKLDRYFQEAIGPTLADDVGEAIGLGLDQRSWAGQTLAQVLAAQPERVTNGNFATDLAGWTVSGGGWAWGSGRAELSGDGSPQTLTQTGIFTIGKSYQITFDVSASGGSIGFQNTLGNLVASGTSGTISAIWQADMTGLTFKRSTGIVSGWVDNVSVKELPGQHGVQASGTLKPTRQATGAKFDGSDDNWLTPYLASATSNFLVALVDVPLSISATQVIVGTGDTTTSDFLYLGFATTGQVRRAVGISNATVGVNDLRGQTAVVGLSFDGSTVNTFEGSELIHSSAQSGVPSTSFPLRVGARNVNGAAANYFGGAVKKLVAGREALTLPRYLQIRNSLLAA